MIANSTARINNSNMIHAMAWPYSVEQERKKFHAMIIPFSLNYCQSTIKIKSDRRRAFPCAAMWPSQFAALKFFQIIQSIRSKRNEQWVISMCEFVRMGPIMCAQWRASSQRHSSCKLTKSRMFLFSYEYFFFFIRSSRKWKQRAATCDEIKYI